MSSKYSGYFRRCHVCDSVCTSDLSTRIHSCPDCGKAWAKFQFFDDMETPVPSDSHLRPQAVTGQWHPIQGLTAYWEKV